MYMLLTFGTDIETSGNIGWAPLGRGLWLFVVYRNWTLSIKSIRCVACYRKKGWQVLLEVSNLFELCQIHRCFFNSIVSMNILTYFFQLVWFLGCFTSMLGLNVHINSHHLHIFWLIVVADSHPLSEVLQFAICCFF